MGDAVYIRTDSHERMIKKGYKPKEYVNKVVKEALDKEDGGTEK